jgi:hypothetical protein
MPASDDDDDEDMPALDKSGSESDDLPDLDASASAGGRWSCPACTLENDPGRKVQGVWACDACEQPKPRTGLRPSSGPQDRGAPPLD